MVRGRILWASVAVAVIAGVCAAEAPRRQRPAETRRVAIVGSDNLFIRTSFSAGKVEVTVRASLEKADEKRYDLIIFNEVLPSRTPSRPFVLVAPPGDWGGLALGAPIANPSVEGTDSEHPLFRHSDAARWHVKTARPCSLGKGTLNVLATAQGKPVIAGGTMGGQPFYYVGFRVNDSAWPRQPGFPVFWFTLLDAVAPLPGAQVRVRVRISRLVDGKPQLLATPAFICLDGKTGEVFIGEPHAFVVMRGGHKETIRRDAGTRVRVTPLVLDGGRILLEGSVSVTAVTGKDADGQPVIEGTTAEVIRIVADGATCERAFVGPKGGRCNAAITVTIVRPAEK